MPRQLVVIALLLSMLMQATAFGGPSAGVASGQAALHSLMHWAGLGHHHHHRPAVPSSSADRADSNADGNLRVSAVVDIAWNTCHQDQSPESTQHLLMDGYISGAAMIPSWFEALPAEPPRPAPPCYDVERVPATPFLEGLRRPPRLIA
jgi:hypothetical protein